MLVVRKLALPIRGEANSLGGCGATRIANTLARFLLSCLAQIVMKRQHEPIKGEDHCNANTLVSVV